MKYISEEMSKGIILLDKEELFEIYFVRLIGTPNQKNYIIPNMSTALRVVL